MKEKFNYLWKQLQTSTCLFTDLFNPLLLKSIPEYLSQAIIIVNDQNDKLLFNLWLDNIFYPNEEYPKDKFIININPTWPISKGSCVFTYPDKRITNAVIFWKYPKSIIWRSHVNTFDINIDKEHYNELSKNKVIHFFNNIDYNVLENFLVIKMLLMLLPEYDVNVSNTIVNYFNYEIDWIIDTLNVKLIKK